ncbi:MAG TPA: acetate--CoA ligase family protein [Candidatus Acidoferrum sp.]|nr:acetate--CoA ligase family protein [Candidatus Acidoferrum sp.]
MTDRPPARSLDKLLRPSSIAIIGASDEPSRIGGRPLAYLLAAGFRGPLYPVNSKRQTVQGLQAYPTIAAVPGPVDFAVIAVPAEQAVEAARDCAARGVGAVCIFTAGFSEVGPAGAALQDRIATIARESGMRVLGPNCLGLFSTENGFYPTFSTTLDRGLPKPGRLSIVTQSGAFGSHIFFTAIGRGLGMRYWITTGNEVDVDVGECLQWAAEDPGTDVIMAYTEGVKDGPRFIAGLEAARARRKPVIFMKVGRSELGAAAVSSHTASLAGADAIYDAVLRRHGAYRARTAEEMVDIAYVALRGVYPASDRLGLVTISGGVGALMADDAAERGLQVPPLPEDAQRKLKELVPFASPRNPIDLTAQPFNDIKLVTRNLEIALREGGYDSLIAFFSSVAGSPAIAEPMRLAIRDLQSIRPDCLLVVSAVISDALRSAYEADGIPVFEDPSRAVAAVAALVGFGRSFRQPALQQKSQARAKRPLAAAIGEHDAKRLLADWGIPILDERLARNVEEAVAAFRALDGPVVLKIASRDIAHKTEVGGVLLNLADAESVRRGFAELMERVALRTPNARIDGVLVAPYVSGGVETIVGMKRDPVFGPFVMFGLGGIFVEVLKDVALRLAPIDKVAALAMIAEIKGRAILEGARGQQPADIDALAEALVKVSQFAATYSDEIESVDINPFLVLPRGRGGYALDALVVPASTRSNMSTGPSLPDLR